MNYTRNQPIFFQKEPTQYRSAPNAVFVRDLGMLNFEEVCEIELTKENTLWIVRYSEIMSQEEYQKVTRMRWHQEIQMATEASKPKPTKKAIAEKLGISVSTLRKREQFIAEGEK